MYIPQILIQNQQTRCSFVWGQGQGETNGGPRESNELENVLKSVSSNEILAKDKIDIMQQAITKCPKISI